MKTQLKTKNIQHQTRLIGDRYTVSDTTPRQGKYSIKQDL